MEDQQQATGGEAQGAPDAAQQGPGYVVPGSDDAWRQELVYEIVGRNPELGTDPARAQAAVDTARSIALELRRPKGQRERIATPAEAAALLEALPDFERALWATAFYTGMRRGELRALRRSDVDLAGRVVHVRRGWDDVEGAQDGKSDAAERDVPILDPLAPVLAAHLLRLPPGGDPLVFGLTAEQPFYPSTVRNRALAAWEAANEHREPGEQLDPIGLHEARHICASTLIASGANPKVIQRVMGHATIQMTFDQYGHLMPGGLEEAAQAANAYLARMESGGSI